MDAKHYDIRIGSAAEWADKKEINYWAGFQTSTKYTDKWKTVLTQARAVKDDAVLRKIIQCQCNGARTKEGQCLLDVRELEGTYFLAKKKHTGIQHRDDCRFFQVDREGSGLKAYGDDVVENDGSIKVGLGLQMKDKDEKPTSPAEPRLPRRSSPGEKRRQVSLLGLLQIIWNAAGFNYCNPDSIKKRANPAWRIHQAAKPIKIKRLALVKHLLVFNVPKENKQTWAYAVGNGRRLFVVAPLAPWVSSKESESGVLPIQDSDGIPALTMIDGLWDSTAQRSFKRVVEAWRDGRKVIAIAQIEPTSKTTCRVVGLAHMRVTEDWLPVDSNYEQVIADDLVAEGRRFIKPLRYDADEDEVFPDFILLDTGNYRGTPMEVFGMTSAEYKARQAEKTDYYNEAFGIEGWWRWIPAEERERAAFPLKVAPDHP